MLTEGREIADQDRYGARLSPSTPDNRCHLFNALAWFSVPLCQPLEKFSFVVSELFPHARDQERPPGLFLLF